MHSCQQQQQELHEIFWGQRACISSWSWLALHGGSSRTLAQGLQGSAWPGHSEEPQEGIPGKAPLPDPDWGAASLGGIAPWQNLVNEPQGPLGQPESSWGRSQPPRAQRWEPGGWRGEQASARPSWAWVWHPACRRPVPGEELLNATNKATLQMKVLHIY